MVRVPLREGRTLHHDVNGRFGAGKVTLRAAPAGTGIIAGGPMRAVFETLGIKDIVAKSVGTSNPHNMIKATFVALEKLNSPRMVATRRGKKVGDLLGRRDGDQIGRSGRLRRMTMADKKTIKVTQTGSPIGRTVDQRDTLKGLGLNKRHRSSRPRGHAVGARHDQQGAAPGAHRRGEALKPCSRPRARREER